MMMDNGAGPEDISVPQLLWRRSMYSGRRMDPRCPRKQLMASAIAWNPNRVRNMILTVGAAETPASYLWKEIFLNRDHQRVRGMFSSSDDEEDEDLPYFATSDMDEVEDDDDIDEDGADASVDEDASNSNAPLEHVEEDSAAEHQPSTTTTPAGGIDARTDDNGLSTERQDLQEPPPSSSESPSFRVRQRYDPKRFSWNPTIRHDGCINTACWMTDDRFLMTSGDDRCIKIWDVTGSGLGQASPLAGGWDTWSPLSYKTVDDTSSSDSPHSSIPNWDKILLQKEDDVAENENNTIELPPPGGVNLVQRLDTGHRGNVFHITPSHGDTKILSSAADGYLRLIDREHNASSVIIDPERLGGGLYTMEMAFCHTPLTLHTGLMCCGHGLLRYDVRAPRTEQRILPVPSKAVAVWPPVQELHETTEPNMVFVGGFDPTVELLDLRMEGSAASKSVVERYWYGATSHTASADCQVSVSGIDISKDGRQLLVSYESDQIYTFPILGSHKAGPTLSDIEASTASFAADPSKDILPSASYGGHFNRLTFLKNAKFAGPNDDYIVTGSDSGHSWFFDRATGAVAAFLAADATICNGVLPHPTLPVFCTYGIASTARLWRAAPCVDRRADDSPTGRYRAYVQQQQEVEAATSRSSLVIDDWDKAQRMVTRGQQNCPCFLPDFAMSAEALRRSAHDGGLGVSRSGTPRRRISVDPTSPCLGNGLLRLPDVLQQNLSLLCTSAYLSTQSPVEQAVPDFVRTIIRHRTKLQADRLGLRWNPTTPWAMDNQHNAAIHTADLIPENPSDWILSDPFMASCIAHPTDGGECSADFSLQPPWLRPPLLDGDGGDVESVPQHTFANTEDRMEHICSLIVKTAILAKQGGNDALKEADEQEASQLTSRSLRALAVRRYHIAFHYCAVLLMNHRSDKPLQRFKESSSKWDPLPIGRILIATRLNLSMVLLRMGHCGMAAAHADEAIQFLEQHHPLFPTEEETAVMTAKAHFRLGSALADIGKLEKAERHFKISLRFKADRAARRQLEQIRRSRRTIRTNSTDSTSRHRKRMWQGDEEDDE